MGLVTRAREGDPQAFTALHDRYARLVHGLLLARVPPSIAAELVQDTFVTVLEKLSGLHDARKFKGWVCSIARNHALDWLRRRKPTVALHEAPDVGVDPPPSAEAEQVLAAIRRLPEAYAVPLALRLVEGMTGPEIAARLDMTHGSVRVNLHKGMQKLKAELGIVEGGGRG